MTQVEDQIAMGAVREYDAAIAKPRTDSELRLLRGRVKHWLRETVMLMVDCPEEVRIIEGTAKEAETQLKVLCATSDTGKVIGKQGRNVRALRIVLITASRTCGHNFTIDIVDANEAKREAKRTDL
jgi:hypothetical protein